MRRAALLASVLVLSAGLTAGTDAAEPTPDMIVGRPDTYAIARLTGPTSINETDRRWNVWGADLGSMFEHKGRIHMTFGDTFGFPGLSFGDDWRSNVMAIVDDHDPVDGLTFASMIEDRPGHAKEILPSAHNNDNADGRHEQTVIPASGVSDGKRMYLHYSSIRRFEADNRPDWVFNHSGIAYSDDDGRTWTMPRSSRWAGDGNFGHGYLVRAGPRVYMFGLRAGRGGPARLARVPIARVLDVKKYEYWDGRNWRSDEKRAVDVIPPTVGELSVRWNSYYRKWILMYLSENDGSFIPNEPRNGLAWTIVMRTADCLTGPWSEPEGVVWSHQVPLIYAPFMPPRWNDSRDIYFAMSRFDLYNVWWWHTSLPQGTRGRGPERCISR